MYRRAARLIITDPSGRLLLFLVSPGPDRAVWITPGGGLEEPESWKQAAVRELREEVGLELDDPGPMVWMRRHVFEWKNVLIDQDERYFWVSGRSDVPDPPPPTDLEPWLEARWWSPAEIRTAAEEIFAPRALADLLEALLAEGPPPHPIDTGV